MRLGIVATLVGVTFLTSFSSPILAQEPAAVNAQADATNLVSVKSIIRFSPQARADVVNEIAAKWSNANAAGVNSIKRIQQFFAEIAAETNGMRILDEDLNYSSARLKAVWPRRFTDTLANKYAGNPRALAIFVYNGKNGNIRNTDDGWTYRGGGLIQLTGRGNYLARGKALGLGTLLIDHPELLRAPEYAFSTAYGFWASCGASEPADRDDTRGVRKLVNGGLNGIENVILWLGQARKAFRSVEVAEANDAAIDADQNRAVLGKLQQLGYAKTNPSADVDVAAAVKTGLLQYQKDNGLSQTGVLDTDTLYSLTDPRNVPKQ